MRRPFRGSDIDRDLSGVATYQYYNAATSGHVVGTAAVDGIERLYTFRHVTDLPLILAVGVAVEDIYAPWWRKAVSIGLALTALCATTVALCLLARREIRRRLAAESALLQAARRLSVMAATDSLTGLANRRTFAGAMSEEWHRAIRDEASIALLMLDADFFKLFNDCYGHPGGDVALQRIATCIRQNTLRPADMAARYGGEEFVLLLPDTELAGALVVAERIRATVADLVIAHAESPSGVMTVSIGVAAARPTLRDTENWLVAQADAALYEAKRAGRNRVSAARGGPCVAALQALAVGGPTLYG
jgi:diguanylate cyclase (GGDEF)-like protein